MVEFTGANVAKINLLKPSDVFSGALQTVVGTVNFPIGLEAGAGLAVGTPLHTSDGGKTWDVLTTPAYVAGSFDTDDEVYFEGHIFKSTADANTNATDGAGWTDLGEWNANGLLYTNLTETKKATVAVTGNAKEKYVTGLDEFLRVQLFNNKILTK